MLVPTTRTHGPLRRIAGILRSLCVVLLVCLLLWQSLRLALRPDQHDQVRQIDALIGSGRYYAALTAARQLTAREPQLAAGWVRLGMVYAIRNEAPLASQMFGTAIHLQVRGRDYDLTRLYQGYVMESSGQRDHAAQFWAQVDSSSSLYPLRRVLEAESLLAAQDYSGAEAAYRAALLPQLPASWRALVHVRLAGLRSSSDVAGALAELDAMRQPVPPATLPTDDLAQPLLPAARPEPRQLAEVLRAAPAERAQMLGQVYLDAGWYALAEAQFANIAPSSSGALAAATYAAYTRLRAGDRAAGQRQLEDLVAAHPEEPRARALLALAYLIDSDDTLARQQLETIRTMAPRAPDTHLAWAQWYTANHDYVTAADEYRRALDDADPDSRGRYELELARFHYSTGLQLCETGWPVAERAAQDLPALVSAWNTLAAVRLSCSSADDARVAAERAVALESGNAEATFYLGRALAALGQRAAARQALIQVADLAPASAWRVRAETQLQVLGL